MAATEAITTLTKGRNVSPVIVEDVENEKVNAAIKEVLVFLSELSRPFLDKRELSAIRNLHLMLLERKHFGNRVYERITSSTLWHEFVKILLTKLLLQAREDLSNANESKRSGRIGGTQTKLLVKMILKDCSPAVDVKILLHHLQLTNNRANTYNLSILLSCLFHNWCDKDEHDSVVSTLIRLTQNPSVSSRIHRLCISLFCSLENKALFLESAREISVDSPDVVARKLVNWLTTVSSVQNISTPAEKIKQASMKKVNMGDLPPKITPLFPNSGISLIVWSVKS